MFDKKLNGIQELSKKIDYKNLNYNFTTKSSGSINFIKFKGPFSLFKKIRDGDILLEMAEEGQEKIRREFGQRKSRNPKHKSEMQLYTIRMLKTFMIRGKKLLIYLIITQKLNLDLFIDQSMTKLREKDLKY